MVNLTDEAFSGTPYLSALTRLSVTGCRKLSGKFIQILAAENTILEELNVTSCDNIRAALNPSGVPNFDFKKKLRAEFGQCLYLKTVKI